MRNKIDTSNCRSRNSRAAVTLATLVTILMLLASSGFGQNVMPSDYKADQVLKSNARVNPTSRAMELSIPIGGYKGRAGNGLPISFNYSSKVWQMETTLGGPFEFMSGTKTALAPLYAKRTAAGWSSNLGSPRIEFPPNVYEGFHTGSMYDGQVYQPMECTSNCSSENYNIYYIKRVQVIMPDGSSHEFRKDDIVYSYGSKDSPGTQDMTGIFLSVDGTRMRLDLTSSDATLFMPDGSRYLFGTPASQLQASSFIDRHGNKMTFNTSTRTWTDTIGRVVADPLPQNWNSQEQTVGTAEAAFPGLGSQTLDVDFVWAYLKDPTTSASVIDDPDNTSQTLYYGSDYYCNDGGAIAHYYRSGEHLFDNPESSIIWVCSSQTVRFNPIVLSQINLPNGQSYQFKYNAYGEITKIIYPTGGYERFKYAQVLTVQPSGVSYDQANRGVIDRWISPKGDGTDEIHWEYDNDTWTTTAPDGTRTEQLIMTESEGTPQPYGFGNAKTGRPYEERTYSSTNQLLVRKLTDYETTGPQSGGHGEASRDLRPTKQVSIIFEPGNSNAIATMTETVYDTTGSSDPAYFSSINPKQAKAYNYKVLDLNSAQTADLQTIVALFSESDLVSISESDYSYDPAYKQRGILGRVSETRVLNPTNTTDILAKSQFVYDETAYFDNNYTTTNWENPNSNLRGNVTTARTWVKDTNTWLEAHTMFDNFGNVRKVWDTSGDPSRFVETEYDPIYKYTYPTKTKAPAPDPTGAHGMTEGSEISRVYDFNTGLLTSVTDANGQTATTEYDNLLRPIRINPLPGEAFPKQFTTTLLITFG